MTGSAVTREGIRGARPGSEAVTGARVPSGGSGSRRRRAVEEPEIRSYYHLPVINQPVWEAPDIPGYLFLGGLAGAGALIGALAQLSGRRTLSRVSKLGAAAASQLSLVALVHDLGRPSRFLNMLRVFKPTSPMSVGSWLLAAFVPSAAVAALSDLTGLAPLTGAAASAASAVMGPPLTTYTAALVSDTAVPAWHEGYRWMPFVFMTSALSAACGLGLAAAPPGEVGPLIPLAVAAGTGEMALSRTMEQSLGVVKEAYHQGRAGKYLRAAAALTAAGVLTAGLGRRSRPADAAAGLMLMAGSALTRFGIFEAGLNSAKDPKYTILPQRRRLERAED